MSGRPGRPLWPLARFYLELLGPKPKISQMYWWVLQLLARIPLTANLDVWKSPKSDIVFFFLVSFPCPSKTSVQKNFCIIKTPFKYPSDPSQRMSVLFDAITKICTAGLVTREEHRTDTVGEDEHLWAGSYSLSTKGPKELYYLWTIIII